MSKKKENNLLNPSIHRRTFLKVSGALASAALAGQVFTKSKADAAPIVSTGENMPDSVETADDIIYSVCQMCHSRCGTRAKVKEGVLVKLDGNPYHPNNRDVDGSNVPDRLPYSTDPEEAVNHLGRLCLKGQSGVQTLYDPYRIQHPLKRVGPRNSGKWETITWEQAFSEIADKINLLIPPSERDEREDMEKFLGYGKLWSEPYLDL
jgi:tetrathionate reductase subunit A